MTHRDKVDWYQFQEQPRTSLVSHEQVSHPQQFPL